MTQVNVTVSAEAIVSPVNEQSIVVLAPSGVPQLAVVTEGPKVFAGIKMGDLTDVNTSDKTDKSVIYYDSSSGTYKADSTETLITITDGGNF